MVIPTSKARLCESCIICVELSIRPLNDLSPKVTPKYVEGKLESFIIASEKLHSFNIQPLNMQDES